LLHTSLPCEVLRDDAFADADDAIGVRSAVELSGEHEPVDV
jgi:hypothetical protein